MMPSYRAAASVLAVTVGALSLPAIAIAEDVGASFDCKKATTKVEKAICDDEFLGFRDGALGALYRQLQVQRKKISNLDLRLRNWRRSRDVNCERAPDNVRVNCVLSHYDAVHDVLSRHMARAGIGPAARGLRPVAGSYGKKIPLFNGTVTVVEMPDLTAWVEIATVNGPTHHLCTLHTASARRVGATIVWQDKDEPTCRVTLRFKGQTVTPVATRGCRAYCGARGHFSEIVFTKTKPRPMITLPPTKR